MQDLYASYPDYDIDVAAEQAARRGRASWSCCCTRSSGTRCRRCSKLWLDEVLAYGWAYGPGGTALHGKDLWLVATTGGPEASYHPQGYNRYFFDAFLPPYEQTAALCGMRFLPPLLLHGAHRASPQEVAGARGGLPQRLAATPTGPSWTTWTPARPATCRHRPAAARRTRGLMEHAPPG